MGRGEEELGGTRKAGEDWEEVRSGGEWWGRATKSGERWDGVRNKGGEG